MNFVASNVTDKLGHDFIRVVMKSDDGIESIRTLTVNQFCKILNQSVEEELSFSEIKKDFYPADTIWAKMADYSNFDVIWREKPGVKCFVYHEKHYMIPFPTLVFALSVRGGAVRDKRCYAQKEKGGDALFYYPFGNVSMDGSICMGSINMGDYQHVDEFSEDFYLGVTNDDYYGDYKLKPKFSQEQALEKLTKLDKFPDRWLNKDESKQLEDLIERFKQNR